MIKKILHVSDIHIRTYQLHDLYKRQFTILFSKIVDEVKGLKREEVRIVITGDIAHQKINISNEQLLITAWFLKELSNLGIVVIIPGNHDFLENNHERLDSISPVVELLGIDSIKFLKTTGIFKDENVKWVVFSLYDHNKRPEFEKEGNELHVGLFHGPIQGLSTDLGFEFEDANDKLNFLGCDLALCGDIHKRQVFQLPEGGKGVMIGSLIQQNWGETIKHHGFGVYDVSTKNYQFVDIESEQPYLHFKITDIKDIEDGKEELLNLG